MNRDEDAPATEADGSCGPGEAPTHSADGVDLTLIRWMLSLSPAQRLDVLTQTIRSLEDLRGGRDD